jgi:hypothetical protein
MGAAGGPGEQIQRLCNPIFRKTRTSVTTATLHRFACSCFATMLSRQQASDRGVG